MWVQRVILLCVAAILVKKVSSATIEEVSLIGDDNDYINVRSDSSYTLQCNFRTGYDEPVSKVTWIKDTHRIVYVWNVEEDVAVSYRELTGRVRKTGELKNLQFLQPISLDISGNYSCEVSLPDEVLRSPPFSLVALDIPSDDFLTNVTLLSDSPDDQKNATEDANNNCTLSWEFKTPAIYPRPNVTCGYYSYLHDDVTSYLPAGLIMQRLINGSWIAGFEHTYVEISSIPRESRLGCSVSVPDTSYKRVVKFEDNFNIDHLIDAEGCPSVFLEPEYRLLVRLDGGAINCRGDLEQISSDPITVTFSCNEGDIAIFPNGTAVSYWSKTMSCDSRQKTWIENTESGTQLNTRMVNSANQSLPVIPTCVQWTNGANEKKNSAVLLIMLIFAPTLLILYMSSFTYF